MRTQSIISALFFLMILLSGCEVIADIFKAGMWVGIILVVLVIILFIWILRKIF